MLEKKEIKTVFFSHRAKRLFCKLQTGMSKVARRGKTVYTPSTEYKRMNVYYVPGTVYWLGLQRGIKKSGCCHGSNILAGGSEVEYIRWRCVYKEKSNTLGLGLEPKMPLWGGTLVPRPERQRSRERKLGMYLVSWTRRLKWLLYSEGGVGGRSWAQR